MSRTLFATLALLIPLVHAGQVFAQDKKEDPQAKPETALVRVTELMEAKKYKQVVDEFLPPGATQNKEEALKFVTSKADQLLADLKALKGAKPEISDDGKTARFSATTPEGKNARVSFLKVDGKWYIR